jgi:hypothetical protein
MGSRRQPRIPMALSASVCGMDTKGRAFVERVRVRNVSRDGALLEAVDCAVTVGDLVSVRCEENTGRFRVIWEQAADEGRRVGLARSGPMPMAADCELPAAGRDEYLRPRGASRREKTRYACEIAAEVKIRGTRMPLWVTASDLSEGGCRVQVPHALTPMTEVSVALWLDEEKIYILGTVAHCIYGCGTGIQFRHLPLSVQQKLAAFVANLPLKAPDRRESAVLSALCEAFRVTS